MAFCAASLVVYVSLDGGAVLTPREVLTPTLGDPATCGAVLLSSTEYASWNGNPFQLDTASALQIGAAILAIWALAWGVRLLADMFSSTKSED